MIYLIGGPPKCGKTSLAKLILESNNIPWVSTDTLQNVVKPYIPEEDKLGNFPASSMRYENNDQKYTRHSTEEVINAYRKQAHTLTDAIKMFVDSELRDGNDYVIEGYHIEPFLIEELCEEYPKKVKGVLLVKNDQEKLVQDIRKSTTPNDWIKTRTNNKSTYHKIAKMIASYSGQLEAEAQSYGVKTFSIDVNFETELKEAKQYLIGR